MKTINRYLFYNNQMGTHLDLEDGLVRMLPYQRPIFLTLGLIYRLSES